MLSSASLLHLHMNWTFALSSTVASFANYSYFCFFFILIWTFAFQTQVLPFFLYFSLSPHMRWKRERTRCCKGKSEGWSSTFALSSSCALVPFFLIRIQIRIKPYRKSKGGAQLFPEYQKQNETFGFQCRKHRQQGKGKQMWPRPKLRPTQRQKQMTNEN